MSQRDLAGDLIPSAQLRILVFANNCTDATADVARAIGGERVEVVSRALPAHQANAGAARRAAMGAALALLPCPEQGLVCTTDADSRPRSDWVARLWQAIDAGAQAVAGVVEFDPAEAHAPAVSPLRARESTYSALLAEVYARIDPQAHNPWPNHIWAWGANMAVLGSTYLRVGGLPPEPLAEDRAFVAHLLRHDIPVRHALNARVWTSARRQGRAAGGLASLIDDHSSADVAPCDSALEPVRDALRRAAWRARLRLAFAGDEVGDGWAGRLGLTPATLHAALREPTFGAAWSRVETFSPRLARRRLELCELEAQIRWARRLLGRLSRGVDDPADRALAESAGLWSAPAEQRL